MPHTPRRLAYLLLGSILAALLAGRETAAQGGIACLPQTTAPQYSFYEVLDEADADQRDVHINDNGHALIKVIVPAGGNPNDQCLVVHRGVGTSPLVCTKTVDPASRFRTIDFPRWNNRGTVVTAGVLLKPNSNVVDAGFPIQVIHPDGLVVPLPTLDVNQLPPVGKSWPMITAAGEVVYLGGFPGSLMRYDPTLPGPDKSALIVASSALSVQGVEDAGGGNLYFSTFGNQVGWIEDAFTSATPPWTTITLTGSFGAPTPNRFGAFLYGTSSPDRIWKRLGLGLGGIAFPADRLVLDFDAADSPFPAGLGGAALAGACTVAVKGTARGVCMQGPRDRFVCDPTEFPSPCSDGSGGPNDGYCQSSVYAIYAVRDAGDIVAVALPGDAMLGSTVQDFFVGDAFLASNAGDIFFSVRLDDGRKVFVRASSASGWYSPVVPYACTGLNCRYELNLEGWNGVGAFGVPVYIDPDIAAGFDYEADIGNRFASVLVPDPLSNGDDTFLLEVAGQFFPLLAGESFDLTAIDPLGVDKFSITEIETGDGTGPDDPTSFVTAATFIDPGVTFISTTKLVPEPGARACGITLLGTLALLRSGARGRRHGTRRVRLQGP